MQNGFQDTFTGTVMGALEIGAMPYSRGLIDNEFSNYVRYDGLINYRAEEVAQQARMLTILALYHSYTGGADDALLLKHFAKAKVIAEWLMARRTTSLVYPVDDPRHGIIPGIDEGDTYHFQMLHQTPETHWYADNAETYRAFAELGEVWVRIGASAGRGDVVRTARRCSSSRRSCTATCTPRSTRRPTGRRHRATCATRTARTGRGRSRAATSGRTRRCSTAAH